MLKTNSSLDKYSSLKNNYSRSRLDEIVPCVLDEFVTQIEFVTIILYTNSLLKNHSPIENKSSLKKDFVCRKKNRRSKTIRG